MGRQRIRFFNKRLVDFTFWPQVAQPLVKDEAGVYTNPDWNKVKNEDDMKKWCASKFQPENPKNQSDFIYVDKADDNITTDEYGWAVNL